MKKIKLMNKIAKIGTDVFDEEQFCFTDSNEDYDAIMVELKELDDKRRKEEIQKWFDDITHRIINGYCGGKRYIAKAKGVAGRDSVGDELKLYYVVDNNEIKERLRR